MSVAYFDCFGGASGNMILGALVDAGLNREALERELRRLPVSGWTLRTRETHKRGLGATYLDVDVPGEDQHEGAHEPHAGHSHEAHGHRSLKEVIAIVRSAGYPQHIERMAVRIFERLAQAEARVHRVPVDEIAFHEVGQIDAIVDITGAVLALDLAGIDKVFCSALPCGYGSLESAHGTFPSPAPATMELLRGAPTYPVDLAAEMVTPTGAAILTTMASFGARPPLTIDRIGYGAGRSDFPFPNVLRVCIGEPWSVETAEPESQACDVVQIETNIDDMNPQLYEHAIESAFAAGALDVWMTNAQMKKSRPGTLLAALAAPERADAVAAVLLAQTTTLGVRRWQVQRTTLQRKNESVTTSLGAVRVKVARGPAGSRARAEYDDCLAIAQRTGMPLADVMRVVDVEIERWHENQRE
jgi:pyridinium-3,5-bisthiocarboxylic acid mononucleotide nickel chelatase